MFRYRPWLISLLFGSFSSAKRMKSFFRDFAIGFVATLLTGGVLLWVGVWISKLLDSGPTIEPKKSERLSIAELLK
jgi:hypothetical protein